MKRTLTLAGLCLSAQLAVAEAPAPGTMLGLPPIAAPADNPSSPAKVKLGDKLFHDTRFSSTGKVACSTCHASKTGFTDSPLKTSRGVEGKTGTRNAPTVLNAALNETQFWDGRSPSLEDQALHPFLNPVEMNLPSHEPIVAVVRSDPDYQALVKEAFGIDPQAVKIDHVTAAIAAFERAMVAGDSPFDRWFYRGDARALTDAQKRGYALFIGRGRCVSCHVIEQTQASFTDHKFHNIGVGVNKIAKDVPALAGAYLKAKKTAAQVDVEVLADARSSELGRFAVETTFDRLGAFKTPTLRNIALTAPYMHDGSIATLEKVVEHYNNGGVTKPGDPVSDFLSGGIRPLGLTAAEQKDLVAFMKALTSTTLPQPLFASKSK